MARARLLKPGFFSNAALSELPAHGRLLFAGLWTLADKAGRLKDEPRWIKGQLFPYESVPVSKLLEQLEAGGFITRYPAAGENLIQIVNFDKHQHPHKNEPESVLPPPLVGVRPDIVRTSTDIDQVLPGGSSSSNGMIVPETVTEAVTPPPQHPFTFAYAQKFRDGNEGRTATNAVLGRALALEKEYGSQRCIEVADAKGWDHDPSYYTARLKELAAEPVPLARPKSRRFTG